MDPYKFFHAAFVYFHDAVPKDEKKKLQSRIANQVGITREYMNSIYKGRGTGASLKLQGKIAEFFGMDYDEFIAKGSKVIRGEDPNSPVADNASFSAKEHLEKLTYFIDDQERLAESLKSSCAIMTAALNFLPTAVLIVKRQGKRLVVDFANQAAQKLFSLNDIIYPYPAVEVYEIISKKMADGEDWVRAFTAQDNRSPSDDIYIAMRDGSALHYSSALLEENGNFLGRVSYFEPAK